VTVNNFRDMHSSIQDLGIKAKRVRSATIVVHTAKSLFGPECRKVGTRGIGSVTLRTYVRVPGFHMHVA
jgi:hypothetical protein